MNVETAPIYLGVCGKFHAFALAREYAEKGRLGGLYAAHQQLNPPGIPRDKYFNRWDIKVWRMLSSRLGWRNSETVFREDSRFDRWLLRKLDRLPGGIFHGWNSHVSTTLRHLDSEKWLRCLERSCPHNQYQHDLLLDESVRLQVAYTPNLRALEVSVQELYEADIIIAPSTYSARTYEDPILQKKIRVNALGANFPYFEKVRKVEEPLRILMVGNTFLRKGTHYLVEAFKQIVDPKAELWIRGDVPENYLRRIDDSRIKVLPSLPVAELHDLYRKATIFCLPSIDEGFGMVAFEALGFGLPVVYTDHCGSGDLLNDNVGIRVPIRSPEAIAAAIERLRTWNRGDYERFDQERRQILSESSWKNCASRMIDQVYRMPE